MEVPVLDIGAAADFMVNRTGDPGPAGGSGAGRRAGRAAAGAGAGRRLHPGQRGQPGRLPGVVPAAAAGPAGPGRADRIRQDGRHHLDAGVRALEQSAPQAVGLLRLLAFCAPEAIPLRLLLQPRPGLAEQLGPEVAPVLVPLLEDPLAAGDAIAALRRYSLVTPAGDGLGVGAPAGAGRHRRPDARGPGRCSGGRPLPP